MARTQQINYGNGIALPVAAGSAHTPVDGVVTLVNELFPARPYNRIGAWVKNRGANVMNLVAPSGSIYKLDAGATVSLQQGFFMEDGAYTITGTAGDVFDFWEAY